MKTFNAAIIVLFVLSLRAIAGEISGVPSITDGDTIKILNKRIRLHGIDTPEKKQICVKNSKEYNCGKKSTAALIKKINERKVVCKVQDKLDMTTMINELLSRDIEVNVVFVLGGWCESDSYSDIEIYEKEIKKDKKWIHDWRE